MTITVDDAPAADHLTDGHAELSEESSDLEVLVVRDHVGADRMRLEAHDLSGEVFFNGEG